jgi:hypothetical protein
MCCASLTRVGLPAKLRKIGCFAFQSCSNLCTTEIPSGTNTIGGAAFCNCNALEGHSQSAGFWKNGRFDGMILHHLLYKMSIDDDTPVLHDLKSFFQSQTQAIHRDLVSQKDPCNLTPLHILAGSNIIS